MAAAFGKSSRARGASETFLMNVTPLSDGLAVGMGRSFGMCYGGVKASDVGCSESTGELIRVAGKMKSNVPPTLFEQREPNGCQEAIWGCHTSILAA